MSSAPLAPAAVATLELGPTDGTALSPRRRPRLNTYSFPCRGFIRI